MTTGFTRDRVVAVVATLPSGLEQVGSGYLVDERVVVTAEHCTRDKRADGNPGGVVLRAIRASDGAQVAVHAIRAVDPDLDVAVLEIDESAGWTDTSPLTVVGVDRSRPGILEDCVTIGFPQFMYDPESGVRGTAELHGDIYQTDGAEQQRLLMRESRIRWGQEPTSDTGDSAWAGLSGALVFYRGRALGVVIEHHPVQGDNSLQIVGFEAIVGSTSLREALGLPEVHALRKASPEDEEESRSHQTAFRRTPRLGLQFRQDNEVCFMEQRDVGDQSIVDVTLRPEPFEILCPSLPETDPHLMVCVAMTDAIFDLQSGTSLAENAHFGLGHGMANYQYGDGSLCIDENAFNYLVDTRLEPADQVGQSAIYVSRILERTEDDLAPLDLAGKDLYLAIVQNRNQDDTLDWDEYEFVRLCFRW